MRRLFVAGNWKMNTNLAGGQTLASEIVSGVASLSGSVDVAVCPPFPYLSAIKQSLANSKVMLGAQNAYFEKPGAFTGEVSVPMLVDLGCEWVILGHSERRLILGESDEVINKKIATAISGGLGVIFCVGEVLEDRNGGRTEAVLKTQLEGGLANFTEQQLSRFVIAYEPVWAIGTGLTATPQQAEETHLFIRKWVASRFSAGFAENLRIQYGGSVKPDNAKELLSQPNVDGALVGGASLKSDQFLGIIQAADGIASSK